MINSFRVHRFACTVCLFAAMAAMAISARRPWPVAMAQQATRLGSQDRSPVDLVIGPGEQWLVTANQTSDTLSLVSLETGQVIQEVPCGDHPAALALAADGRTLFASCAYSGEVVRYDVDATRLVETGRIQLPFEPQGLAIAAGSDALYVALFADNAVSVVSLPAMQEQARIRVGKWPRWLTLSPDGRRLAVGTSGDRGVGIVDVAAKKLLYLERFSALNLGQVCASNDGKYAYMPWIEYRQNPITPGNIRAGWVMASRIARIRLDGPARRQAIALDVPGKAVSDPHGLQLMPGGERLVASASGTHELLVFQMQKLTFQDYGGPGDHMDPAISGNQEAFYRIPLGGRPMNLRASASGNRVWVANYLLNCVQEVDLDSQAVARTLELSDPSEPTLARRGEAIFFDGQRSLDQWYSCHSCHYAGGTNAVVMDTLNDGSYRSYKTVLSLHHVAHTGPWTWHGWQQDLHASLEKSLKDTMLGPEPTPDDVQALAAYLQSVSAPPNPLQAVPADQQAAVEQGRAIFGADRANCIQCHSGDYFTDGQIHDVGTGSADDAYQGFNTPSLRDLFRRVLYLHDGRASSLEELLTGPHDPAKVTGCEPLSPAEVASLIAYLKTL